MSPGEPDKVSGLKGWGFLVSYVVVFLVFGLGTLEFFFCLVVMNVVSGICMKAWDKGANRQLMVLASFAVR